MFYIPLSSRTTRPGLTMHLDRLLAAAAMEAATAKSVDLQPVAQSLNPALDPSRNSTLNPPFSPALDLAETDSAYTVTLDMPGVRKEDVKVSVEGRRVSIQASSGAQAELKKEGERLIYRERSTTAARYARQFTLPLEVDATQANAQLEHGVLTLTLPKRAAQVASQITIN